MIKSKGKKISIKTRILISILGLIGTILIVIGISFNLLVDKYIEKSSHEQLKKATELAEDINENPLRLKAHQKYSLEGTNVFFNFMKEIQEKVKRTQMGSDAESIVIDEDYNLIFPTDEGDILKKTYKYTSIADKLKSSKINLENKEKIKISTKYGDYYVSFVKIKSIDVDTNYYLVLFIDISTVLHLAKEINVVLFATMCIASILTIFTAFILSKNIAKPIQQLCDFAKQIGEGNFERYNLDFKDKELDELAIIMNKSAAYLDKYDKEQKIFFQNASHELRTPLMSIKGYAEAIKYNVIDKETASDVILEESNRLTDMVEELLYISKIDNITKDYTLVECDLREILSNCTLKQKIRAIDKNIEFIYEFDKDPVLFKCDEKSMYRAILNIIENSLRYAKSKIIITCTHSSNNIIISIEDDGNGIKEKDLDYIFDRFYKGEKGKHGIGLSIVKSIVEQHNGKVSAMNTNIGAKFIMIFEEK